MIWTWCGGGGGSINAGHTEIEAMGGTRAADRHGDAAASKQRHAHARARAKRAIAVFQRSNMGRWEERDGANWGRGGQPRVTPRCDMVRAASACLRDEISSTITTSGL
jgi:hypothetical protein